MTPAESVFWEMVRRRKMFNLKFRRQQVIEGFIADFFCDELKLVVEIDGDVHNNPVIVEQDKLRTMVFENRGLTVLRFSNSEVFESPEIIRDKLNACRVS